MRSYVLSFIFIVTTIAIAQNTTSNPERSKSMGSHVSNIQTLNRERDVLTRSIHRWNRGYQLAMLLLVIGAVASFMTQRATIIKTERLDSVDDQIFREKDALATLQNQEFADSLADKELKIQELKADNLKLEAAIAPRRLSEQQKTALSSLAVFANRIVEVKSYATDTEGLLLATEIAVAVNKSHISIIDNRLTMVPSGSIDFGVAISGSNTELVKALREILRSFASAGSLTSPQRGGVVFQNSFGRMVPAAPPDATIEVGPKPLPLK